MICPSCGFEQAEGAVCLQCLTPLTPPPKESPSSERKRERKPKIPKVAPVQPVQPPQEEAPGPMAVEPAPAPREPSPLEMKEALFGVTERAVPRPVPEALPKEPVPEEVQPPDRMIVTTTPIVEGRPILAYHGLVMASALIRGDLVRDFFQGETREVISTRTSSIEVLFEKARAMALSDLKAETERRGGNAVVGLAVDQIRGMDGYWIHLTGTAVTLKE
jgi:uncharacterized protein YbjQ (UPF0145 family)